ARPAGLRPEARARLKCEAGETVRLIVRVFRLARKVALQQLHHPPAALGRDGAAGHDLGEQTGRGVGRQLVTILELRAEELPLAPVGAFAPGLLVDVDAGRPNRVAE